MMNYHEKYGSLSSHFLNNIMKQTITEYIKSFKYINPMFYKFRFLIYLSDISK